MIKDEVDTLLGFTENWVFLNFEGKSYVSMESKTESGTRRDTLKFGQRVVRKKLLHIYHQFQIGSPDPRALASALGSLEARAEHEVKPERVWIRTAYVNGRVYLDLADHLGQAVEISESGWKLTQDPPCYFYRTSKMEPLPVPVRGGSLDELQQFANLDRQSFILVAAWLAHSLFPLFPHAIMLLEGGQGTGKSSLARLLRSLVDPNSVALRKAPRDDEEMATAAANNWIVVYDNLGKCPGWFSDTCCGISTGSGYAARAKYSDSEEHSFSYLRPVILTALPGLLGKSDMVERTLKVELSVIPDSGRKTEGELLEDADWEAARPRLLGALLDAVSCALRNKGKKRLSRLPRMADFAQFIVGAEDALPFSGQEFLEAFDASKADQVESMIEADPVATAVRLVAQQDCRWRGTVADLTEKLRKVTTERNLIPNPRQLGTRLRLAEANLRAAGVQICFERSHGKRYISLHKEPANEPS
jgi:hypothetical protein